jgi:hypothetical protein
MNTLGYRHCGERVVGPIPTRDGNVYAPLRITRDQLNSVEPTGQTISRGKVWTGEGVNARLDSKAAPVRAFVGGYTLGNVIHAVDPGQLIDLARTYKGLIEDEDIRAGVEHQIDALEREWVADPRSGGIDHRGARDRGAKDSPGAALDNPYPAEHEAPPLVPSQSRDAMFNPARTEAFARNMKSGRTDQTSAVRDAAVASAKAHAAGRQQPTRSRFFDPSPARSYAERLRAGRAAKSA